MFRHYVPSCFASKRFANTQLLQIFPAKRLENLDWELEVCSLSYCYFLFLVSVVRLVNLPQSNNLMCFICKHISDSCNVSSLYCNSFLNCKTFQVLKPAFPQLLHKSLYNFPKWFILPSVKPQTPPLIGNCWRVLNFKFRWTWLPHNLKSCRVSVAHEGVVYVRFLMYWK